MNSVNPRRAFGQDQKQAETVLFLPGYLCDARVFSDQIMAFGHSNPVQLLPVWSGGTVAEMASRVLAGAPRHFALVGHSLGAAVAMDIVRMAPERVTRLAVGGCSPLAATPPEAAAHEPSIVSAQSGNMEVAVNKAFPVSCLAESPRRKARHDLVVDMGKRAGAEVLVRQARAMQRRPDQQRGMCHYGGPVLVFGGADDKITSPRRHEFLASLVKNARLEVFESAGHFPTIEQPQAVSAALRAWLDTPLRLA